MRTGLIAALAALLAGCASVRAVNPDSGIVEGASGAGQALAKADAYCAKTGRTAHAAAFNDLFGTLMFDCVAR
jgi:uncharacterized protein YceK